MVENLLLQLMIYLSFLMAGCFINIFTVIKYLFNNYINMFFNRICILLIVIFSYIISYCFHNPIIDSITDEMVLYLTIIFMLPYELHILFIIIIFGILIKNFSENYVQDCNSKIILNYISHSMLFSVLFCIESLTFILIFLYTSFIALELYEYYRQYGSNIHIMSYYIFYCAILSTIILIFSVLYQPYYMENIKIITYVIWYIYLILQFINVLYSKILTYLKHTDNSTLIITSNIFGLILESITHIVKYKLSIIYLILIIIIIFQQIKLLSLLPKLIPKLINIFNYSV